MGDCKTLSFTSKLPAVARLIGFANATSHADADVSKYFFANGTRDGTEPVSGEAKVILADVNGNHGRLWQGLWAASGER